MRNSKVLAGLLAAVFLAPVAAIAADLRPVYKAPPPVVVTWNWSGFYIGGHAGGGWSEFDTRWDPLPSVASFGAYPFTASHNNSGFVGGAHAGFNWQVQNWVFGVEGDWSWSELSNTVTGSLVPVTPGNPAAITLTGGFNWLASARGRVGFLAAPQMLVYGTGGVAFADIDATGSLSIPAAPYLSSASSSDTRTGWVIGGGFEWMATSNWLFRVEYLYYDFGSGDSITAPNSTGNFPGFPSAYSWSNSNVHVIRGGISYKFDWGRTPVVAKY